MLMTRTDKRHPLTDSRTNARNDVSILAKYCGEPSVGDHDGRNLYAVRRGMEAVWKGDTIPAEEVFAEVRDILGL